MTKLVSLPKFKKLNAERSADAADYLYYVSQEAALVPDFVEAMLNLLDPTFFLIDDLCLIEEIRAPARYREHLSMGLAPQEAQYWANLFDAAEFILPVGYEIGVRVARLLFLAWNASLVEKMPMRQDRARLVNVPGSSEILVTVTRD